MARPDYCYQHAPECQWSNDLAIPAAVVLGTGITCTCSKAYRRKEKRRMLDAIRRADDLKVGRQ